MKDAILSLTILLFITVSGYSQTCTRHVETSGRFSYCPPSGWISKPSSSGGPYKKFVSPESLAPVGNINIKDEVTSLSHNDYIANAVKLLLKDNKAKADGAIKIVEWTDFVTDSKIRGSRLVYETSLEGIKVRIFQFVLDLRGRKLIVTGGTAQEYQAEAEPLITATVKSLRTY